MAEAVISLSGGLEEAPMKVAITTAVLLDGVSAGFDSLVEVDVGSV